MTDKPGRPTTLAEMRDRALPFRTTASWEHGLAFQPQPTDIIISPPAKTGTTWIQQIVHGLRTRGSMDFEEICEVVPWLESVYDLGIDLDGPQVAQPRAYKSHFSWHDVPKGARYIYTVRDPRDVLVSFFHFLEGWWFEAGSVSISTFARDFFMANWETSGDWNHIISWWQQRHNQPILFLCFEDMKADLPQAVRRIAAFMGCELDDELFNIVVRQSSIEFMLAHKSHFDEHLVRNARDKLCGLPPGGDAAKVRTGRVGDYRHELPGDICDEMDEIWRNTLGATFGLSSYQALREAIAAHSSD